MEGIQHKTIKVNGIDMDVAEKGEGPVVLFIHGFPLLWYSWRHQILYVAANGYRAVAPDLRGYGGTTGAPVGDPTKFTLFHLVGDLIALLDAVAPEEEQVFVVAHDWGAIIAWFLCQCRPERVKALVIISIHFLPRDPKLSSVEVFRGFYGDNHYFCRFQVPGKVEAEFAEIGVKEVIKKLLTNRCHGPLILPKGEPLGNSSEVTLPGWLSEEDVDYYAAQFEKTGFTGGINYYRALNLNWELTAPWTGAKVKVPVKFIVGDLDLMYHFPGAKEYIHNGGFLKDVPLLEEVVVMEGVGHYANQEKPDEVNKHILDFINKF